MSRRRRVDRGMDIVFYQSADKERWDGFVRGSKNGTFLFLRDYMDYHSGRFEDCSLIVQGSGGRIISVLPAARQGEVLLSHAGLTYGGFISDDRMTAAQMVSVFNCAVQFLATCGFSKLLYKTVPYIYHSLPAEEDRYALFLNGAMLYRRDVLTVIDYGHRLKFQERRARAVKRALQRDLTVRETDEYEQFWEILTNNLRDRYRLSPVHSVDEITLLARRFPDEIRLFASYDERGMQGGAVVYLSQNVCHVQYNAASEEGKRAGALDAVLSYLIDRYAASKRYFDFGVSTEDGGKYLNIGLVEYKEGFGARTVTHEFYELALRPSAKG